MNPLDFLANLLQMLLWHPGTGVLIALLLLAAWIDWRSFRVPNWLTASGMVWGLTYNSVFADSALSGLGHGLLGLVTGLALLLPLYAIRVMGAGDVKLMAMVGAFLGALATVKAVILVGIAGGLAVLLFTLSNRATRQLATNLKNMTESMVIPGMPLWRPEIAGTSVGKLPYGVSISVGTLAFLVLRQLGYA